MKREIKFRAWIKTGIETYDYVKLMTIQQMVHSKKSTFSLKQLNDLVDFEQFTGLKDKNGREIYEGDVVRYTAWHDGKPTGAIQGEVVYDGELGMASFDILLDRDGEIDRAVLPAIGVEVIGNIHEDPELLEAEMLNRYTMNKEPKFFAKVPHTYASEKGSFSFYWMSDNDRLIHKAPSVSVKKVHIQELDTTLSDSQFTESELKDFHLDGSDIETIPVDDVVDWGPSHLVPDSKVIDEINNMKPMETSGNNGDAPISISGDTIISGDTTIPVNSVDDDDDDEPRRVTIAISMDEWIEASLNNGIIKDALKSGGHWYFENAMPSSSDFFIYAPHFEAGYKGYTSASIRYCPICGRNLRVPEKESEE